MADGWRTGGLIIRIIQLICAVVVMALIGNMINNSWHGATGTVNYALFPPAFAMAVLIYAIPVACRSSLVIHPGILFILDFLVMLCTFAAAVALPSKLHAKSCSNEGYTSTNEVTRYRTDLEQSCREAQAASAFLWFLWAAFLASTVMSAAWMLDELQQEFGRGRRGMSEKRQSFSGGTGTGPGYAPPSALYGSRTGNGTTGGGYGYGAGGPTVTGAGGVQSGGGTAGTTQGTGEGYVQRPVTSQSFLRKDTSV